MSLTREDLLERTRRAQEIFLAALENPSRESCAKVRDALQIIEPIVGDDNVDLMRKSMNIFVDTIDP